MSTFEEEQFQSLADVLNDAITVGVEDIERGTDLADCAISSDDEALFACGLFAGYLEALQFTLFSERTTLMFQPHADIDGKVIAIGIVLARALVEDHASAATTFLWALSPQGVHAIAVGILYAAAVEAVRHDVEVREPARWN